MIEYDAGYGELLTTRVRIATWNIWGRYGPWEERLPVIRETLAGIDADIVGLQEVWEDDDRNQARWLAGALGYEGCVFAANLERDGARSGNAVLARWPLRRSEVLTLPREAGGAVDDEGEERLCVLGEVDGPRGPIQVYCAHLSWRGDHGAIRQAQVRAICAFVREQRPRSFPAVLVGDLNSVPNSDELRMLTGRAAVPVPGVWFRDAWEAAGNADPGRTVANANPFIAPNLDLERRIDYVLVAAPKAAGCGHVLSAEVVGDRPIDGMWGSDHYGVAVDLRY
jgi:endonuclease/exonuclease/phosphatase family metal-dependent hydrolase